MVPGEITEGLYRAFKGYSSYSLDQFSPLNDQEAMAKWTKILRTKPLRELQDEDLQYYAFKAMTTWGDAEAFKHFLPRILELIGRLEWTGIDVEIVFGKLAYGHWKTWPRKEQEAIHTFCTAFWQHLVTTESPLADWQIRAHLRGFAEAGIDLPPLLGTWLKADSETAVCRLCLFIEQAEGDILKQGRFGWGKEHQQEHGAVLKQWFRSDEMKQHLSDCFFRYVDTPSAEIISRALQFVE